MACHEICLWEVVHTQRHASRLASALPCGAHSVSTFVYLGVASATPTVHRRERALFGRLELLPNSFAALASCEMQMGDGQSAKSQQTETAARRAPVRLPVRCGPLALRARASRLWKTLDKHKDAGTWLH